MTEYKTRIIVDRLKHYCEEQPNDRTEQYKTHQLYGKVYSIPGAVKWSLHAEPNAEDSFRSCPWCGDRLPQDVDASLGNVSARLTI